METAMILVMLGAALFGVADFVVYGSFATAATEAFAILGFGWTVLLLIDAANEKLREHYQDKRYR